MKLVLLGSNETNLEVHLLSLNTHVTKIYDPPAKKVQITFQKNNFTTYRKKERHNDIPLIT